MIGRALTGVAGLYLVFKGLTTGAVSPITPVPEVPEVVEPPKTLTFIEQFEIDQITTEEIKETELERKRKADWLLFDTRIRESPPDCKGNFRAKLITGSYLSGIHSRWICERVKGIGL